MSNSRCKSDTNCSNYPSDKVDSDTDQSNKDKNNSLSSRSVNTFNRASESSDKPNCNDNIEVIVSDSEEDEKEDKPIVESQTSNNPNDTIAKVIISDTNDANNESGGNTSSSESLDNFGKYKKSRIVHSHSGSADSLSKINSDTDRSRSPIRSKTLPVNRNISTDNSKVTNRYSLVDTKVEIILSDTSENNTNNHSNRDRSASPLSWGIPNIKRKVSGEKVIPAFVDNPTVSKREVDKDILINTESMNLNIISSDSSEKVTNIKKECASPTGTDSCKVASVKRKVINTSEDDAKDTRRVRLAAGPSNIHSDRDSFIRKETKIRIGKVMNITGTSFEPASQITGITYNNNQNIENSITNKSGVEPVLRFPNNTKEPINNISPSPKKPNPVGGKRRFEDSSSMDSYIDDSCGSDDDVGDTDDSDYESRKRIKKVLKVMCKRRSRWRKRSKVRRVQLAGNSPPPLIANNMDCYKSKCETMSYQQVNCNEKKSKNSADVNLPNARDKARRITLARNSPPPLATNTDNYKSKCESMSYQHIKNSNEENSKRKSANVNVPNVRDTVSKDSTAAVSSASNKTNSTNNMRNEAPDKLCTTKKDGNTWNGSTPLTITFNDGCIHTTIDRALDVLLEAPVKDSEMSKAPRASPNVKISKNISDKVPLTAEECTTTDSNTRKNNKTDFESSSRVLDCLLPMPLSPIDPDLDFFNANNKDKPCIDLTHTDRSKVIDEDSTIEQDMYNVTARVAIASKFSKHLTVPLIKDRALNTSEGIKDAQKKISSQGIDSTIVISDQEVTDNDTNSEVENIIASIPPSVPEGVSNKISSQGIDSSIVISDQEISDSSTSSVVENTVVSSRPSEPEPSEVSAIPSNVISSNKNHCNNSNNTKILAGPSTILTGDGVVTHEESSLISNKENICSSIPKQIRADKLINLSILPEISKPNVSTGNESSCNYSNNHPVNQSASLDGPIDCEEYIPSSIITTNNETRKNVGNSLVIKMVESGISESSSQLQVKLIDGVKAFLEDFPRVYCSESDHTRCQNKNTTPAKNVLNHPHTSSTEPNIVSNNNNNNRNIETIEIDDDDDDSTNSNKDLSKKPKSQNDQKQCGQGDGNLKLGIENILMSTKIKPVYDSDIETIKIDNDTDSGSEATKQKMVNKVSVPKPKILNQCKAVRRKIRIVTIKRRVIDRGNRNIDVVELDDDDEVTTRMSVNGNKLGPKVSTENDKCLIKQTDNLIIKKPIQLFEPSTLGQENIKTVPGERLLDDSPNMVISDTETQENASVENLHQNPILKEDLLDNSSVSNTNTQENTTPENRTAERTNLDTACKETVQAIERDGSSAMVLNETTTLANDIQNKPFVTPSTSNRACNKKVQPIERNDDSDETIPETDMETNIIQEDIIAECSKLTDTNNGNVQVVEKPGNVLSEKSMQTNNIRENIIESTKLIQATNEVVSKIEIQPQIILENVVPEPSKLKQAPIEKAVERNETETNTVNSVIHPVEDIDLSGRMSDQVISEKDMHVNITQETSKRPDEETLQSITQENMFERTKIDIVTQDNTITQTSSSDQACKERFDSIGVLKLDQSCKENIQPTDESCLLSDTFNLVTQENAIIETSSRNQAVKNNEDLSDLLIDLPNTISEPLGTIPHKIIMPEISNLHQNYKETVPSVEDNSLQDNFSNVIVSETDIQPMQVNTTVEVGNLDRPCKQNDQTIERNVTLNYVSDTAVNEKHTPVNITLRGTLPGASFSHQTCEETLQGSSKNSTQLNVPDRNTISDENYIENIKDSNASQVLANINDNDAMETSNSSAINDFNLGSELQYLVNNDKLCNEKFSSNSTEPDLDSIIANLMVSDTNDGNTETSLLDEQIVDFVLDTGADNKTEWMGIKDIQLQNCSSEKESSEIEQCSQEDNIEKLLDDYILNTDKNGKCSESNIEKEFDDFAINDESSTAEAGLISTKSSEVYNVDLNDSDRYCIEENNNNTSIENKDNSDESTKDGIEEYNTENIEEQLDEYHINDESMKIFIEKCASESNFENQLSNYIANYQNQIMFTEGFLNESYNEDGPENDFVTSEITSIEENDPESDIEEKFVDFILNDDFTENEIIYGFNLDRDNGNGSATLPDFNDNILNNVSATGNVESIDTSYIASKLLDDTDVECHDINKMCNKDAECETRNEIDLNSDAENDDIDSNTVKEYVEYVMNNESNAIVSVGSEDTLVGSENLPNTDIINKPIYSQLEVNNHHEPSNNIHNMIESNEVVDRSDDVPDASSAVIHDNDSDGCRYPFLTALRTINDVDENMDIVRTDKNNTDNYLSTQYVEASRNRTEVRIFSNDTIYDESYDVDSYTRSDFVREDTTHIEHGNNNQINKEKVLGDINENSNEINTNEINAITNPTSYDTEDAAGRNENLSGYLSNLIENNSYSAEGNSSCIVEGLGVINYDIDNNQQQNVSNCQSFANYASSIEQNVPCDTIMDNSTLNKNDDNAITSFNAERFLDSYHTAKTSNNHSVYNSNNNSYSNNIPIANTLRPVNNDEYMESDQPIGQNETQYQEQDFPMDLSAKRVEKVATALDVDNSIHNSFEELKNVYLNEESNPQLHDKAANHENVTLGNYNEYQYRYNNSNYLQIVESQQNQRILNTVPSNPLKHSNMDVSRLCFTPDRNILNSVPPPIMVF